MTFNFNFNIKEAKVCTESDQREFYRVLGGLADHLECIARRVPYHPQGESFMSLTAEQTAIVKRFDDATSAISDELDALIAAGPSSPEFMNNLQSIADRLDVLGKKSVPGPGPQPTQP